MIDKKKKTVYIFLVANKSDIKRRNNMKNYQLMQARKRRGYSQSDMAEFLGIDRTTYNYKENGLNQFKIDEINKILILLKVSYEDIFAPSLSQIKTTKK